MKIIKFIVALTVFAFVAGNVSAISAPSYTYQFTASPDQTTIYDGSTITLQGTSPTTGITLADWNLLGWSGGPVTPGNSSPDVQSFSLYGPSTFYGSFDISGFEAGSFFNGSNTIDGGFLQLFADPPGVWRPVAAGVPDAGSTLALLAVALGCLVAVRRFHCAQA